MTKEITFDNKNIGKKQLLGEMFIGSKTSLNLINKKTFKLDKNDVLLYKIPYTNKFDYYPIFIARFCLGNLEMYLETKNNNYKDCFFKQSDWLLKNIVIKNGFAVWEHYYKVPFYNFNKIPWVHGLGQGLGMTALLKAYQLTEDKKYLNLSKKVLNSFEVDIADGGVRYIDEYRNVWYEEYAILPPPHVLNGLITILFGINEFYRITKLNNALILWRNGLKTLKKNLNKYDMGYWSFYNLLQKYPAPVKYHSMHIKQLRTLYDITHEEQFIAYSKKWGKGLNRRINIFKISTNRKLSHLRRHGISAGINTLIKRWRWKNG